jgi:hypothetical protein
VLSELTAKQRKALFVRIGFQGEASSVRQIPRFRLNPANVNRVFNCDVEYLQEDATGNIIWPKNWATDCLPPPYLYFIREKVWPELDPDALEADEYRGKTLVVVDNAPEEATDKVLVAWLNAGLDDDDPDLASAKIQLEELQENLGKVEKQVRELPSMKVQGSNAKEELEMKKKRAQTLNMQKIDLEEDIRALKEKFDKLRRDREAMVDTAFKVRLAETKQPLRLNVWELSFARDKKGQRNAYIAVHKFNWSEFRVAVHRYTGAILTGKNDLVGLTAEHQEVNMRNVTVSRRKHGIGMHKFGDERGFYSGHWRHGLRHGMGTEINQQGRFQGNFEKDWRRGPGSQVFSNGDTFRGPFGGTRHHLRESLIFGDEYADGLPHGVGKARFVDGSVYEGEWADGVPCGKGKYVSATGAVVEGVFGKWAVLHGYGSHTIDDVTRIGTWQEGLLHGRGTEIDAQAGTYEGDWRHGEKHGHGKLDSKLVGGAYEGWYHHGHRWGRGVLNYGNVDRDKVAAEAKMARITEAMKKRSVAAAGGGGEGVAGDGVDAEVPGVAAAEAAIKAAAATAAAIASDGLGGEEVGGGARVNEYDAMRGDPVQFIPFRGDYCYEGRWRAGGIRTGGVFTKRFGRPEPNLHVLTVTNNGRNPRLPLLAEMTESEDAIARKRAQAAKASTKEVIDKRLLKEAENLASYVYWKRAAEKAQREVRRKTRRGKRQLEEIKAGIKKPERTLAEGAAKEEEDAYSDDSFDSNASEGSDDKVADKEDMEFML